MTTTQVPSTRQQAPVGGVKSTVSVGRLAVVAKVLAANFLLLPRVASFPRTIHPKLVVELLTQLVTSVIMPALDQVYAPVPPTESVALAPAVNCPPAVVQFVPEKKRWTQVTELVVGAPPDPPPVPPVEFPSPQSARTLWRVILMFPLALFCMAVSLRLTLLMIDPAGMEERLKARMPRRMPSPGPFWLVCPTWNPSSPPLAKSP